MLPSRVYQPAASELIYHYCDATAFLAICTGKKMRFSDAFSMNDFMEMHWGYRVWERAATVLLERVGREFLDRIDVVLHGFGLRGLPVVSCYSKLGDVLSQWRAYADDGQGYAIGFHAQSLLQMSVRPLEVLYEEDQQIFELQAGILALHKSAASEETPEFGLLSNLLAADLAALKNPAFKEEQEVRLLHLLDFEESNSSLRLVDAGGRTFTKEVQGVPVSFRMRQNAPVAYIDLDFSDVGETNPIKQVIVGPKNGALLSGISVFLETIGLGGVEVRRSQASYR
jgi:hypothetical protein